MVVRQSLLFENFPTKIFTYQVGEEIFKEEKMIRGERKQLSLFGDNWLYKIVVEKFPNHPLVKMKPIVDKILKELEKEIRLYYTDFGRPSRPSLLLKMLLLEYLYNLSDVAVCQAVAVNILFRWFCDLDIDEEVPDDTTLVKFRKRLGKEGFKEIFETFIKEAKKLGYGKGKLRILDATHVYSFSRGFGLVGVIRDGIKRVVKRIREKGIMVSKGLKKSLLRVTEVRREVKKLEVKKVIKRLERELSGKLDRYSERVLATLGELLKKGRDKIGSLVDLDARWGYKSKDFPFFGYKIHLVCDEDGFVTNLEVLSGEKNEGNRLKVMMEEESDLVGVVGDAIYDSAENRAYCKGKGIKAFIPSRWEKSEIDRFAIEGEVVRCWAGRYSCGKIRQGKGFLHYFSVRDCCGCRYYGRCVSPCEVRKKVYFSDCKRLREGDYREKQKRRKVIERVFGWAKRWLGLSRARYWGIGKVFIQAVLTFLILDLKVMIRGPCEVGKGVE